MQRERILGYAEVSDWTGVPVNTLKWWRRTGKGPRSALMGRRVAYRESDVQAWIDSQFENGAA